jgi:hypothetical protein
MNGLERLSKMSWQSINTMLGLALVDPGFASKLLANPLQTALEYNFDLTLEEQAVLRYVRARDITEFSKAIQMKLRDDRGIAGRKDRETPEPPTFRK